MRRLSALAAAALALLGLGGGGSWAAWNDDTSVPGGRVYIAHTATVITGPVLGSCAQGPSVSPRTIPDACVYATISGASTPWQFGISWAPVVNGSALSPADANTIKAMGIRWTATCSNLTTAPDPTTTRSGNKMAVRSPGSGCSILTLVGRPA